MNWECPYCKRAQTVTGPKIRVDTTIVRIADHALGVVATRSVAIACSNDECKKLTLRMDLIEAGFSQGQYYEILSPSTILSKRILPESYSKPQPDYIPPALRNDYEEACLVRDLSPKSAATLARRCLQGMIRDFAKISRKSLNQEIIDLRKAVEQGTAPRDVSIESVAAIDHVRTIGNIGAHMEADVDHIIAVEPGEAQILIELIESLFDEWYVERYNRQQRFSQLAALADEKKLAKSTPMKLTDQRGE